MPKVAILMGSKSDLDVMRETVKTLEELEIDYEMKVLSTHRNPDKVREYAKAAEKRGIQVIIAGCGGACHLPGAIASYTILPIIGVPIASTSLLGIDALFSIVQMPGGVPVGSMGIGESGARNAALFAAEILGAQDPKIGKRLKKMREEE